MAKVKLLDPSDQGRLLDRYELIGELATGGMATVYLARLGGVGGFQRFVAIKRLHPHLADEEEFVQMFLDEARLAAGIHHPHVVPILEVGTNDNGYYLVMEYIEGDTLARIVARSMSAGEMVPRPILVRVLLDSLSGLHAAHELTDDQGQLLGLVHRDVSPQNLLVGVDGSARITDFGVARASARLSNTGTGRLKGKLAYMAPEQTRGDDLDRRTDVFAMGVILWEVLAGQRLFKAGTEAETLSRIIIQPIPRVTQANPDVPALFEEVTSKALDRDPDKRFRTAAEMADALERVAKEIGKDAGSDVGVASPRDVASFVQKILGQEIGAQRESVRVWLAQSEPSSPAAKPASDGIRKDVTIKVPLDQRAPSQGSPQQPQTQQGTLLGPGVGAVAKAAAAASAGSQEDPTLTTPRLELVGEGSMPEVEVDDQADTIHKDDADFRASIQEAKRMAPGAANAYEASQREADQKVVIALQEPSAPPPAHDSVSPVYPDGGIGDYDPYVVTPPRKSKTGRIIGLIVGFVVAFLIGLVWVRFRPMLAEEEVSTTEQKGSAKASEGEQPDDESERTEDEPDQALVEPTSDPASSAEPEPSADPEETASPADAPPPKAPPPKTPPPKAPPPKAPPPKAPPPAEATAEPETPPPPPPPPKGEDDDLTNPYR